MTIEKKLERVMEIGVALNYKIKHEDMRVQLFRDVNRHYETNLYRMDNILALWMEFNEIVEDLNNCIPHLVSMGRFKGLWANAKVEKWKKPATGKRADIIIIDESLEPKKKRKPIKAKVVSCEANIGCLQRLSMEVTLQIRPKPKEASRIGDWFCNHEDVEIVGLDET